MSKVAELVSERPRGWLQYFLRLLPHRLTRTLIVVDLTLATCNPLWGWWLYRRWTDKRITWVAYWPIYKRWLAFTWQHIRFGKSHAGLWSMDWRSPPVRHAQHRERAEYRPKGSCGTCNNCCKTSWLPPAEQIACPFLGDNRCTIYGGLCWDYFNCGRYPTGEPELRVYACPRFSIEQEHEPSRNSANDAGDARPARHTA